jgi:CRP-like cAMP-binding protein
MTSITARLVRRLEHFAPLSAHERHALDDAAGTVRRFESRDDLAKQGDPVQGIFGIIDGFACRYKILPDGRRQTLAFLLPGDLCDPRTFLLSRMDHSVAALGPVEASVFAREAIQQLSMLPNLAHAMAWSALVQHSISREWLLNVGHRSSFERISHLFCEVYARLDAVGLASDQSCDVPLTQTEIADALAISPVHVNRTLMELRHTGLVSFHGKRLVIHEMAALRRAAGFNPTYLHLRRDQP